MKTFHERLAGLIGGNIPELRKAVGIADQSMRKWIGEKCVYPRANNIIALCEAKNVSPNWLLLGVGPEKLSETKQPASDHYEEDFFDEFTLVPLYKARLSGGHGSLETSDQIRTNMAFRTEFVRSKGNNGSLALFEVIGDSMEPFIYEGDVVMVDMSQNDPLQITDGKVYAYREGDVVKVKRLAIQGGFAH